MAKKKVTQEELKEKYGNKKVMVVPEALVRQYISKGVSPILRGSSLKALQAGMFRIQLGNNLVPMLRWQAECDPSYKQPIPYVIVKDKENRIFVTTRLQGDARLQGMCSIGTGGHLDEGESVYEAMYRELEEEVGVTKENIFSYCFTAYILDEKSQVNSVHLGLCVELLVDDPAKVRVLETEKLSGEWMTLNQVDALLSDGKLESWSAQYVEKGLL